MFAFGVDGPRGADDEACADERGREGVPRFDFFVREHYGECAVRMEDAVHLAERGEHFAFVILLGEFFLFAPDAFKARGVGDGFIVLVGEFVAEKFWKEVSDAALEPDVEKVRKFGIHHVVIVRWVNCDVLNSAICITNQVTSRILNNLNSTDWIRKLSRHKGLLDWDSKIRQLFVSIYNLAYAPIEQIRSCIEFTKAPRHCKIVTSENVLDYLTSYFPGRLDTVVIKTFIRNNSQVETNGFCSLIA